ncbi:MAG: nucleotidyltransferase domain-containing protein [Thermoleophilia bacterium]
MYTIDQLFTSRARVELLKLFLLNPELDYYLREAASLTDLPLQAIQREVEKLTNAGLLEKTARGNRVYLRANRKSPIFEEMRSIIIKTVGLGDALRQALDVGEDKIRIAFIFGSLARGEDTGLSDIDLIVIGAISGRELASLLSSARKTIGREINQLSLTEDEFKKRLAEKDHFLSDMIRQPKLFLIGDEDVLKEIISQRQA